MLTSVIVADVKTKAQNSTIVDATLVAWLNNGYHDIINKIVKTCEDYFGITADISIVATTQEYDLDDGFKKHIKVNDENGNRIGRTTVDRSDSSVVGYYLFGSKIGFKPVPTASATYKHWFIKNPTDLVYTASPAVDSTPDFDANYHHLLILWGLKEYYESQQDLEYANHYFSQYKILLSELLEELDTRNLDTQPKMVDSASDEGIFDDISP